MEEKHYVYFIVHKEQNKRYYGVRTDKHLNTPDIFTGEYNTSSKDSDFVDEFTNHKDRFTITVEYFPTRISAEKAEKFLLSVYDARNNPDFYNKWNGDMEFTSNKNKVRVYRNNQNKLITKDSIPEYLLDGWLLGISDDAKKKLSDSQGTPVQAYIKELNLIVREFKSVRQAAELTNTSRPSINCCCDGSRDSAGIYDIDSKLWNSKKIGGRANLPDDKHPTSYRVVWRYIKKPKESKEEKAARKKIERYSKTSITLRAYIKELDYTIGTYYSSGDAEAASGRRNCTINQCSLGYAETSGTYNIETKEWNEKNFFTRLVLPNKDYPNTYRVSWEQIK